MCRGFEEFVQVENPTCTVCSKDIVGETLFPSVFGGGLRLQAAKT